MPTGTDTWVTSVDTTVTLLLSNWVTVTLSTSSTGTTMKRTEPLPGKVPLTVAEYLSFKLQAQ